MLLALIAGLVGIPALTATTATPVADRAPSYASRRAPYREGVVGHPASVSPLTARTQADRDLVALVFSGLVRNGPDGTIVPDLADELDGRRDRQDLDLRPPPDARWQDGEPVTADDVVFTIRTLQDPAYTRPGRRRRGARSRSSRGRPLDGHVHPDDAARRLPRRPRPSRSPRPTSSADVPVDLLADDPFGRQPVGSGPFALVSLDDTHAELVPAEAVPAGGRGDRRPVGPRDRLARDRRPDRPPGAARRRTSPGSSCSSSTTPDQLVAALPHGELDAASGLPPADGRRPGDDARQPAPALPGLDADGRRS